MERSALHKGDTPLRNRWRNAINEWLDALQDRGLVLDKVEKEPGVFDSGSDWISMGDVSALLDKLEEAADAETKD